METKVVREPLGRNPKSDGRSYMVVEWQIAMKNDAQRVVGVSRATSDSKRESSYRPKTPRAWHLLSK